MTGKKINVSNQAQIVVMFLGLRNTVIIAPTKLTIKIKTIICSIIPKWSPLFRKIILSFELYLKRPINKRKSLENLHFLIKRGNIIKMLPPDFIQIKLTNSQLLLTHQQVLLDFSRQLVPCLDDHRHRRQLLVR